MKFWRRTQIWRTGVSAPHGDPSPARFRFRRVLALLRAMAEEIFDETAYQRFLHRRRLLSSATAYAAFLREQEFAKARRPRCC